MSLFYTCKWTIWFNSQLCLLIRLIKPFHERKMGVKCHFIFFISVGQVAPVVHAAGSCPHGSAHGHPSSARYVLPIQVSLKREIRVGMGYYGLDSGLDYNQLVAILFAHAGLLFSKFTWISNLVNKWSVSRPGTVWKKREVDFFSYNQLSL